MTGPMVNEPPLLDAEAEHRAAPRTFSIPRRAVREALAAGDLAKLLFVVDPPAGSVRVERMWVEVLEAGDGAYVGRLVNAPGYARNLRAGDLVSFRPHHIAAREAPAGDAVETSPTAFAIVSGRVWHDDAWPRRLERRAIPDPQFSGWFVFAGDESDDDLANPSSFVPVAHATLFERFPVLDSGLEGPVGTHMAWSDEELEFQEGPARPG